MDIFALPIVRPQAHELQRGWRIRSVTACSPARRNPRPPRLAGNFTWCDPVGAKNRCAPSWNQHIPQYCGACFLHGTLSMVQDRLAIMKGGGSPVMLSRQTFLNCAPFANLSGGCDGGDVIDVRPPRMHCC